LITWAIGSSMKFTLKLSYALALCMDRALESIRLEVTMQSKF